MPETADITTVTTNLFKLLKPLEASDRQKVIRAALTLLGDSFASADRVPTTKCETEFGDDSSFPAKAQIWMKKNGLTEEELSHVFHVGSGAEVIASEIPGKTGKEKTINAYILTGISSLIKTGEAKFEDKIAREVCKSAGCFADTNHATYMKGKGNLLGGSKASGWILTVPGLKAGADLIKELAGA